MKDRDIIAIVTFALFSTEAYGHYLVAKNEDKKEEKYVGGNKKFVPKLFWVVKFEIYNCF